MERGVCGCRAHTRPKKKSERRRAGASESVDRASPGPRSIFFHHTRVFIHPAHLSGSVMVGPGGASASLLADLKALARERLAELMKTGARR